MATKEKACKRHMTENTEHGKCSECFLCNMESLLEKHTFSLSVGGFGETTESDLHRQLDELGIPSPQKKKRR
jgi:hypothetical protein